MLKMTISTSIWDAHYPNAGRNIQQPWLNGNHWLLAFRPNSILMNRMKLQEINACSKVLFLSVALFVALALFVAVALFVALSGFWWEPWIICISRLSCPYSLKTSTSLKSETTFGKKTFLPQINLCTALIEYLTSFLISHSKNHIRWMCFFIT